MVEHSLMTASLFSVRQVLRIKPESESQGEDGGDLKEKRDLALDCWTPLRAI